MELQGVPVTTPLFLCDAFADKRFKGNQAAVCLVPTSVYCMEWSQVNSLEASFGRGEPEQEQEHSEEEREKNAQRYTEERHAKMGRAFLNVAGELGACETAFVYRLPASRVKAIQDKIKIKMKEFEGEYEEKCAEEDRRMSSIVLLDEPSGTATDAATDAATGKTASPPLSPVIGLIPSASFTMGGAFGASFLQTRGSSMIGVARDCAKRPRRMHTQWFGLRWFSQNCENSMCGHATIAAAHAIFETSRLCHQESTRHLVDNVPVEFFIPLQTDVLCFVTDIGIVSVRRKGDADENTSFQRNLSTTADSYEVHFPANEAFTVKEMLPANMYEDLASALGLPYGASCIEDVALSTKEGHYVVRLATARNVFECRPTEHALRAVFESAAFKEALHTHAGKLTAPRGLCVTAENNDEITVGDGSDAEIISRVFAPWIGRTEDAASGVAHTVITPYWLRHRKGGAYKVGDQLTCYQASRRGGYLKCIIIGRKAERIALIGSVVTFMRGTCNFTVEE